MMTMRTTARKWRSKRMCPLENHKNSDLDTPPPPTPRPPHPTTIYKKGIRDRVWHFGFETFWFFLMISVSVLENFGIEKSIGIGFKNFWYRKKYRFQKIWYRKSIRFWKYFWRNKKSSQKYIYQGVAMLVSANPEILSKISKGGGAFFCWWPEILSKISRGGGACFCQSGNTLKNIKGWRCFFSADDQKSSQKYQGVAVLVLKKGLKCFLTYRLKCCKMMFSIQLKDEYYSNINRIRIRIRIYSVEK